MPASPLWRLLLGRSIADHQATRVDNLLLLRLLAAALVIFGHSYAVKAGLVEHDLIARMGWGEGIYTGALAVDAFFFISGFLVTGSWIRQQSLRRYLQARIARVLPGYWALLLASVLLLGPLYTVLPLWDYATDPRTWAYLWGNAIYDHRWSLPGVFDGNRHPSVLNGSLWTLRPEMMAYLLLAAGGVLGLLRRGWLFALAMPAVIALLLRYGPRYLAADDIRLFLLFGLGSAAWMGRRWLRLGVAPLLALPTLAWWLHGSALFGFALMLSVGFICLWLAYVPSLPGLQPPGDYSYGLYLWGYPVQQIVVFHTGSDSVAVVCLLSLLLAGILAVLSWHRVEAPWLRRLRPEPGAAVVAPERPPELPT